MTYLALGDSVSIDTYTGVPGGGAASQFARLLGTTEFINLTRDGHTSDAVLKELHTALLPRPKIDVVTLTIGGNDLLSGFFFREVGERNAEQVAFEAFAENLRVIAALLAKLGCPVILNTIYDPTDGNDAKATELGLPAEARQYLERANDLIRDCAAAHRFLLCDLERLFFGHGFWSTEPWIVMHIEPNMAGATAIAAAWYELWRTA